MKNTKNSSTICHPELVSRSCRLLNKERSRIKCGMTLFNNNTAFTLIELLVVVLIIGILAAVALPQYQKAVEKSRASEAITLIKSLADAEKIYYLAHGEYTNNLSSLDLGLNIDASAYTTKDWLVVLRTDRTVPRISASRTAYEERKGQYYIGYDLTKNMFFCSTNAGDTKGIRFCSSFNITSTACNHSAGDPCYYF